MTGRERKEEQVGSFTWGVVGGRSSCVRVLSFFFPLLFPTASSLHTGLFLCMYIHIHTHRRIQALNRVSFLGACQLLREDKSLYGGWGGGGVTKHRQMDFSSSLRFLTSFDCRLWHRINQAIDRGGGGGGVKGSHVKGQVEAPTAHSLPCRPWHMQQREMTRK